MEKVEAGRSGEIAYVDFDSMDGLGFEHFVAKLLSQRGFSAEVTKGSGDLGVDILATNPKGRFAIQVKRYNQPVSRRAVSDAVAGRDHYKCDFAMVITNNYFTNDAKKLAGTNSCLLVDRDELQIWITGSSARGYDFTESLNAEIARLQDAGYLWGEEIVAEATRELRVEFKTGFGESHQIENSSVISPHNDSVGDRDHYVFPNASLLNPQIPPLEHSESDLRSQAMEIAGVMNELGLNGRVVHISPGPVVTSYEYQSDEEIESGKLRNASRPLRNRLGKQGLRITKTDRDHVISVDVLNDKRDPIGFREIVESEIFHTNRSPLTFGLGRTTNGGSYVNDLCFLSNFFVAGATNRKRTAGIDALICSILFKARPDEVRWS